MVDHFPLKGLASIAYLSFVCCYSLLFSSSHHHIRALAVLWILIIERFRLEGSYGRCHHWFRLGWWFGCQGWSLHWRGHTVLAVKASSSTDTHSWLLAWSGRASHLRWLVSRSWTSSWILPSKNGRRLLWFLLLNCCFCRWNITKWGLWLIGDFYSTTCV